ncbi:LysR family transcriptional regulator [Shewanella xiamenensis]|uniref:LysR family transcriptional regulator n=1 Tax=Shewanella xiamenensis TaxID=332186 RepID=UPI001184AF6C|nr:LysR family transcriptional regulator [Shewanella xiamenensis]TVL21183.1 LysR family transcriptional regulator [Shewanella xiamenensis]TVL21323.1 LysR family transcriptional regulator [Shewanella xiamenensis]TVL27391.1 LysR family transcriptional regulator [Shewanella xiamenensis]TVL34938.1 LysR family transcriptional regulator [Shewanella xiamenensis]TVL35967.1 LysR family transcriptional regulator [Shewanella xiamenensis]
MHIIDVDSLDILSLKILVLLYESKSATYVSKALDVPAPKISRSLKNLREVFGDELFVRRKYGLFPNEFVTHLYPIAKQTIECADKFQEVQTANANRVKTHVEIAVPGLIAYAFPKALMQAIKEEQKSIQINITPWSKHTSQDIINGDVTLGVCCSRGIKSSDYTDKLIATQLQNIDKLYLVAGKNHPIFKQDITLESIAQYPYINGYLGHSSARPSPFQTFCAENRIDLETELTITSISSLFEYLIENQSITLLPYRVIHEMASDTPELHTCQLSQLETERLHANIEIPSILLIQKKQTELDNDNLIWLIQQIKQIINDVL